MADLALSCEGGPAGGGGLRVLAVLPALLRSGAVAALAWAVVAPARVVPAPAAPGEGVAVMVALDVSGSMDAVGPDGRSLREAAGLALARFLEGREGDAVGLVTFAGDAVVRLPPAVAPGAVGAALAATGRGASHGGGTALGDALGLAAHRLRPLQVRSRVVVLVTDGGANAGALDPVTAAASASALGQTVYVLAVDGGSDEPPSLLARVAEAGGGRLWRVGRTGEMEAALAEIGALEPSRLPGAPLTARLPASPWPLALGLVLLLSERLLRASRWGRLP